MKALWWTFALFSHIANATLVVEEDIQKQMASAELVADIYVELLESQPDPTYHVKSRAVARVLALHDIDDDGGWFPKIGEKIAIETLGGEWAGTGVAYSGYPRPYAGRRYRATLKRLSGPTFQVAGFSRGLIPLDATRDGTRNRTDGSNGTGTGPFLFWQPDYFPVPYFISMPSFANRQAFVDAVDRSFATWRDPQDVRLEFVPMGCTTVAENRNDGVNAIIFQTDHWEFDPAALAITRNFYVSGSGARAGLILDTDILVNGFNHDYSTTGGASVHDMQNIMTHEVGHFIGLGHEDNPKDADATMFESAAIGETKKRTLGVTDAQILFEAYGGVAQKTSQFPSTAACNVEQQALSCLSVHQKGSRPMVYGWILLIVVGILALGRYRLTTSS